VPHLNKSLARSNKNLFNQGFLTGIVTINLREFIEMRHRKNYDWLLFLAISITNGLNCQGSDIEDLKATINILLKHA